MTLAPASVVAVPMTVAPALPSATKIARPIPRVAPVTNATSPTRLHMVIVPDSLQSGLQRIGIRQRRATQAARDSLVEPRQHFARSTLQYVLHTSCSNRLNGFDPAHRTIQLLHQRLPDRFRRIMAFHVGILNHGSRRRIDCN